MLGNWPVLKPLVAHPCQRLPEIAGHRLSHGTV
jgi:hypothetical protein